uniref:GAF domain-containing protein n=1 Tax=Tetradesmus obliquus TaxID=3088 RepID=A0A383V6J3_TETOB|eukprot:jgi/Sobl393_1/2088/SZX61218.1
MVEKLHPQLPVGAAASQKASHYKEVIQDLQAMLQEESSWVAAMATTSSVLHQAFEYFHWTGFYCLWPDQPQDVLVVGPYQGSLGCLRIPFGRGVCGAAASSKATQLVPDVHAFPGHIACASSTQSEVVVPLLCPASRQLLAVLDVDSNTPAAFDEVDVTHLEQLCVWLASKYGS